ncbi:MAG: hypothetical protein ACKO3B_06150 [Bacteroidota bacterium]
MVIFLMMGCKEDDGNSAIAVTKDFTFESGAEEWQVGYADYPSDLSLSDSLQLYEMSYGHGPLPAEIQPPQKGIRIRGANRSDDLFMYLSRKITGLRGNTDYAVTFEIQLASNAPTNAVGIGGAPGEGVVLKAGAVATAPKLKKDEIGWYRPDLDKGNQSIGGKDLIVLGNIGVKDDTRQYELITRTSPTPQPVRSDANGNLWLMAGTDSGFEGRTELYYARIKVAFTPLK